MPETQPAHTAFQVVRFPDREALTKNAEDANVWWAIFSRGRRWISYASLGLLDTDLDEATWYALGLHHDAIVSSDVPLAAVNRRITNSLSSKRRQLRGQGRRSLPLDTMGDIRSSEDKSRGRTILQNEIVATVRWLHSYFLDTFRSLSDRDYEILRNDLGLTEKLPPRSSTGSQPVSDVARRKALSRARMTFATSLEKAVRKAALFGDLDRRKANEAIAILDGSRGVNLLRLLHEVHKRDEPTTDDEEP